ncbi:glycosyl transferase [Geomonas silvestris]|uniref:Glycosyl transferase n=1 Tax=Geomonas silvestris TaxID=2740184 RepID=A0A6V8MPQ0_9BACT|nr:WecB/TagA/CpsF family glycosyltransferase [Geomonas silvestris]GFO61683.1 glycosyl transferase [Geomonas silvestris]
MNFTEVPYVKYDGVKVNNICYRGVLDMVIDLIKQQKCGYICLTDVSNLIVATKNPDLRLAINDSMLSLADGMPLVWYAKMVGCKEIERISGAALMKRLIIDMGNYRHFLLGDTEDTIEKVIAEARKLTPNIFITGHSPPFKDFDDEDNRDMLEKVRTAKPDIIWVCFGGVKQERWMNRHIATLDRGVMIGVGAAFRFFIGEIVTPPEIFQKMGLQWLFRLGEAFIKNPIHCIKLVHQRHIMTSKVEYLVRLPLEVAYGRQRVRQTTGSNEKTDQQSSDVRRQ